VLSLAKMGDEQMAFRISPTPHTLPAANRRNTTWKMVGQVLEREKMKEDWNCESQETRGWGPLHDPRLQPALPRGRLRTFGWLPGSLLESVRKAPCPQVSTRVFKSAQRNHWKASNQTRDNALTARMLEVCLRH
jgi:hypothetical protein